MEKSTLKITRTEQTVTVKKKPSILLVVIYIVVFAACVGLPFLFPNAWNKPLLWGLLICCLAANFWSFLRTFLGKTVIHTATKELCIYNPFRHTRRFDEVAEVRAVHERDPEGSSSSTVILTFHNGGKLGLHTVSQEQAEELAELLRSVLGLAETLQKLSKHSL